MTFPERHVTALSDAGGTGSPRTRQGVVALLGYFVTVLLSGDKSGKLRSRLAEQREAMDTPASDKAVMPMLQKLGQAAAEPFMPKKRETQSELRRRLAYDADPAGFSATYADAESEVAERIVKAQALVPHVRLDDEALLDIAKVCAAFEVDGMRADIVTARTAVASGSGAVSVECLGIRT